MKTRGQGNDLHSSQRSWREVKAEFHREQSKARAEYHKTHAVSDGDQNDKPETGSERLFCKRVLMLVEMYLSLSRHREASHGDGQH